MNPNNDRTHVRIRKTTLLVGALILGALLFGLWLGSRSGSPKSSQPGDSNASVQPETAVDDNAPGVKSIVSYTLPDGWKEAKCPTSSGSVYIIPAGAADIDCDASPSSPVKISADPGSSRDCNELQDVRDVKKHICISLYINSLKSLKASTEYLASSSYKKATTIDAYYVDAGEDVIKVEHIYSTDNKYQAGFDQLANSVKSKN